MKEGTPATTSCRPGAKVVTRIVAPLRGDERPPGAVLDWDQVTAERLFTDPALAGAAVFETPRTVRAGRRTTRSRSTPGGTRSAGCPQGATEAWLFSTPRRVGRRAPGAARGRPAAPRGGRAAPTPASPATPTRRTGRSSSSSSEPEEDDRRALLATRSLDGELQIRGAGDDPLPLLHVRWRREDALRFPLWLSRDDPERGLLRGLSVARGNLAPADHGLTGEETQHACRARRGDRLPPAARPRPAHDRQLVGGRAGPASSCRCSSKGRPTRRRGGPFRTSSTARPSPRTSSPRWSEDGRAVLRFGDGEYGRSIAGAIEFTATYRVGNGAVGNVGAEALAHVALPPAGRHVLDRRGPEPAPGDRRARARDARGGARARAAGVPGASSSAPSRVEDWARAAREAPGVQGAVARFRWTGSWYAVVVGVDPRSPPTISSRRPDGRIGLEPGVRGARARSPDAVPARRLRPRAASADLRAARARGRDLRRAGALPRETSPRPCVEALSARALPGGRRGFFHPERFTFGQAVYLSRIYAAVEAVEGVDTALVRVFRRYGAEDDGELASGVLPLGRGRDRAARERPELRRARRAPRRRAGRQGMSVARLRLAPCLSERGCVPPRAPSLTP